MQYRYVSLVLVAFYQFPNRHCFLSIMLFNFFARFLKATLFLVSFVTTYIRTLFPTDISVFPIRILSFHFLPHFVRACNIACFLRDCLHSWNFSNLMHFLSSCFISYLISLKLAMFPVFCYCCQSCTFLSLQCFFSIILFHF